MRTRLVALAALTLVGAATLAARDRGAPQHALPSWIPKNLARLGVRPADPSDFPVSRRYAVEAARLKFLPAAPEADPVAYATLVTGRVLPEDPAVIGPSGDVEFRKVEDAPAWLIIWRSLEPDVVKQFMSQTDADVDVVLFVDGVTGECCLVSPLFLSGDILRG